jgi:predicted transposase/invertase (TIGR01784 family)
MTDATALIASSIADEDRRCRAAMFQRWIFARGAVLRLRCARLMSNPHDALFKAVFAKPEHARGALRAVLPAKMAEALDWSTLEPCAGSFVDPALRGHHTDLLFSVNWRGGGEPPVYALFEHQSTSDGRMAYRVLRYLVRIWERWLADHPRAEVLPVIVPVVLYHGAEPWSAPVEFESLLEMPDAVRAALAPHLVRFRYVLDDLTVIPEDRLRARSMSPLGRLAAACFKFARTRADLLEILDRWAHVVREVIRAPDGLEALVQVMRYILLVNDQVETEQLQAFLERVAGPDAKDTIMTAGERLIQQGEERGIQKGEERGIQKGIQQGEERGIQKGLRQGERGLLLRLLRQRFAGQVNADIEARVEAASSELIATWAERVISVATLADVLAD